MAISYRPDIDGLRAIAVLAVVFFHLGIEMFSGGYVGVDVFFVISGYLITSIIVRDLDANRFSIARFYERRCRRILPALGAVTLATLAAGFVLFDSTQLKNLGGTSFATAFFSSNFNFFMDTGYFAAPSESKPLLHTWSLAVEEQYYIFFPLLMIGLSRFAGKKYARWLTAIGICSLAISVFFMHRRPAATFFLLPARTWELLIGSLLAVGVFKPTNSQVWRNILSIAGLVAILASVHWYTDETPFPGYAALLPTVGTALIIYAGIGGKSIVGQAISLKPVVFIGLISYSLYLWHWPAIVFAKYYAVVELTNAQIAALLAVVLLVSALSWKYIEGPFRKDSLLKTRRQVFVWSAVVTLVMAVFGGLLYQNGGYPSRYEFEKDIFRAVDDPYWDKLRLCERQTFSTDEIQDLCTIGTGDGDPEILLWGDSHARAIAAGVDSSARANGTSGVVSTRSACFPLLGVVRQAGTSCKEFNDRMLDYVGSNPTIETVILAGRWALATNGTRVHREEGKYIQLEDTRSGDSSSSNDVLFGSGLGRIVGELQKMGRKVVLVEQVPEVGYEVPSALFVSLLSGRDVSKLIAPSLEEYSNRNRSSSAVIDSIKSAHNIDVLYPADALCGERCRVVDGRVPLYLDAHHLSVPAARSIASIFDSATQPRTQGETGSGE